ncbi:MAG: hypothetical protein ABH814_03140 [bacterium]
MYGAIFLVLFVVLPVWSIAGDITQTVEGTQQKVLGWVDENSDAIDKSYSAWEKLLLDAANIVVAAFLCLVWVGSLPFVALLDYVFKHSLGVEKRYVKEHILLAIPGGVIVGVLWALLGQWFSQHTAVRFVYEVFGKSSAFEHPPYLLFIAAFLIYAVTYAFTYSASSFE